MKRRLIGAFLLLGAVLTLTAAVLVKTDDRGRFIDQRVELVIRQIGHSLLLSTGDATSRILPVKKLGNDVFQLEFEHTFSFAPDSLVSIVQRSLAAADLPLGYLVSVFECSGDEMVYGFEAPVLPGHVLACRGRIQPTACYSIQIAFTEPIKKSESPNVYYFGSIAVIGMALLAFVRWKPRTGTGHTPGEKITAVGALEFEEKSGFLKRGDKLIHLSNKESKLLKILASNMNQLVDRDQLQDEIWTNEGVITSRSLDMFISKLRKKLSDEPSIRIVNIHGRGYRLEVDG